MRNESKVAKIINEEFDGRMDLAVLQYLCEQVGIDRAKEITDEEIEAIEGNAFMTKEFCQAMVRCARRIARDCSFVNDIVPYMVENFEHLTGHITKRKAVGTLRRLIESELECYSIGTVRSELVDVPDGLTRKELDDIGGYGWLCDVDEWDGRMFNEMEEKEMTA